MQIHHIFVAILLIVATLNDPATADSISPLPPPDSGKWRPIEIPKVEKKTSYTTVRKGDVSAFRAESECGASGLAASLENIDLAQTPILHWQWRIEKGLTIADEKSKAGDDFAARVIVMFRYDPEQATFVERTLHKIAETVQGETLPGRALAYVWSSNQPTGQVWKNPFRTPTILLSRGSGTTSDWRSESIDVGADYRKHWGAEPPPLAALAVLTDADNTCAHAIAEYAGFHFSSR